MSRPRFGGSGPGEQTADGCSVELYRRLPYMGELDAVAALFGRGDTVLDLGCGTGRLAGWLVARGLHVTGVDASAAMLGCLPPGVTAVQSTIEALALDARFDTVLLASHLINHPDAEVRAALLASARRHLKPGGRVVLQRFDDAWLDGVQAGPVSDSVGVESVERSAGVVAMTLRYAFAGEVWRQSFEAVALTAADIETALRNAGFRRCTWHGAPRLWASATAP